MKTRFVRLWGSVVGLMVITSVGTTLTAGAAPEVVAWGWNEYGQTNVPAGLSNVVAVAAGSRHSLALTAEGCVMAWGANEYGQSSVPSGLTDVVAIAAGATHNLALTAEGRVVAWGGSTSSPGSWPNFGQVDVPAGLTNVVAVAAGGIHSLALTGDGRVVAWGDNYTRGFFVYWSGQAIVPAGLSNVVAIAAGYDHSAALAANGQVVVWGNNDTGQLDLPPGLGEVVDIAAGNGVTMAMTAEGTFFEWGWQGGPKIPAGVDHVVASDGGMYHTVALTAEGRFWAWGVYDDNLAAHDLARVPSEAGAVVTVAAGDYHNLALMGAPPGVAPPAWTGPRFLVATSERPFLHRILAKNGVTTYGAEGLPPGLRLDPNTGVIRGTAGAAGEYILGLSATNGLGSVAWTVTLVVNEPAAPGISSGGILLPICGEEFYYPVVAYNSPESYQATGLPPGLAIDERTGVISGVPVTFGDYAVTLTGSNRYGAGTGSVAMRVSPVVEGGNEDEIWMDPSFRLVTPGGLSNVVAIAVGLDHRLALTAEGRVFAWGNNFHGQYGQTDVPAALSNAVAIAAGEFHNLALTPEGRVLAWGAGLTNAGSYPHYGQSQVPVGLSNVVAIATHRHSLALRADGTVAGWGQNDFGQADVPLGLSNVVAISARSDYSVALTADGQVVAWGRSPVTVVPHWLSNVVAIAASSVHSMALTGDGQVTRWGDGDPRIMPGGWGSVVAIAAGPNSRDLVLTAEGRVLSWDGGTNVTPLVSHATAIATGFAEGWLAVLRQPTIQPPELELAREAHGLALLARGTPGIACQLLRASQLPGPWFPSQTFSFTEMTRRLRMLDSAEPAQFFRLLQR